MNWFPLATAQLCSVQEVLQPVITCHSVKSAANTHLMQTFHSLYLTRMEV
jgi:hypothetical protein